ncbi:MAG: hypothetical protein IT546_11120 [Caulobacteraceae bacterium]|nr:hypothetical protein [Caulobacteraceae bacterium]
MPQAAATLSRAPSAPKDTARPKVSDTLPLSVNHDWRFLRSRLECVEVIARKHDDLPDDAVQAFERLQIAIVEDLSERYADDLLGLKVKARALAHICGETDGDRITLSDERSLMIMLAESNITDLVALAQADY